LDDFLLGGILGIRS